jgi:DeoR/GlpR family transcriptional regulator of sugar metabolism
MAGKEAQPDKNRVSEKEIKAPNVSCATITRFMTTQDELKAAAASAAAAMVGNGMIVGLGSGTTAAFAATALAERVAKGLSITGIATSEKTAALARSLGMTVAALDDYERIDVTIEAPMRWSAVR